jgi:thiamine-phosphate diphosphorylase
MFSLFPKNLYPILDQKVTQQKKINLINLAEYWNKIGMRCFQFRFKCSKKSKYLDALFSLPPPFFKYFSLISNDFPLLYEDFKKKEISYAGVHLGQEDLHPLQARNILTNWTNNKDLILGLSTHNEKELLEAHSYPEGTVNYIACGPYRGTSSKTDTSPVLGFQQTSSLFFKSRLPVVLIGGIRLAEINEIRINLYKNNIQNHVSSRDNIRKKIKNMLFFASISDLCIIEQSPQKIKNLIKYPAEISNAS